MAGKRRLIVGISGASGVTYGVTLLKMLRGLGVETHLVMSRSAQVTLAHETDLKVADVAVLADFTYPNEDIGAAISSGSFHTDGMLVAPCSIRTLSEIASGITASLLSRAADVVLKERRRLVLMVRETPLHLGHIRSMAAVTEIGAVVMPPAPDFATPLTSLGEMVERSLGQALQILGLIEPLSSEALSAPLGGRGLGEVGYVDASGVAHPPHPKSFSPLKGGEGL